MTHCDKYNKSMKICSICKCVMPLKVFIKGDLLSGKWKLLLRAPLVAIGAQKVE